MLFITNAKVCEDSCSTNTALFFFTYQQVRRFDKHTAVNQCFVTSLMRPEPRYSVFVCSYQQEDEMNTNLKG